MHSCGGHILITYPLADSIDTIYADSATPTHYAIVTRLSPVFRVRVWLRETSAELLVPSLPFCLLIRIAEIEGIRRLWP